MKTPLMCLILTFASACGAGAASRGVSQAPQHAAKEDAISAPINVNGRTASAASGSAAVTVLNFKIGDYAMMPWTSDGAHKTKILDLTKDGLFLPDFIGEYFSVGVLREYHPVSQLQAKIADGSEELLKVGDFVLVPWASGAIKTRINDLTEDGLFAVDFIDLYLNTNAIKLYRQKTPAN